MDIAKLKTSRLNEKELEQLSPFELKDNLIKLATDAQKTNTHLMLNAGRGNPNWIVTQPREAFFALGKFGLAECKRNYVGIGGIAGVPIKEGCAKRFESFLAENTGQEGIELLKNIYQYGIEKHDFKQDDWVFELTQGIVGNQYPNPVRMLAHTEVIVHDYLIQEMCGGKPKFKGKYDVFAVEGGTAAMCYLFDSLVENGLLKKGDTIALGVPAFTPYLEIPQLAKYSFEVVYIESSGRDADGVVNFQYPNEEIDKLGNRVIKAFFVTNPSNPNSVRISDESIAYLEKVVRNLNPNLMILTDDVYGTFVEGFSSLMNDLAHNTLCVYSFSKYFGATGWRLGVIALAENNVYDKMISALPKEEKERMATLYDSLSLHPDKIKFIDRLVANSRQVALNHTAGLSLPQQIQMLLFAGFSLLDKENIYKDTCMKLIQKRFSLLWQGIALPVKVDKYRAGYYCEIDIKEWALNTNGQDFVEFLEKNFEPVDIVFRLAEKSSIVLLNGGGFDGPEWSVRVSLANLDDEAYSVIGKGLLDTFNEYVAAWKKLK